MTTPDRVHLDHAATTTVRPTALAALAEAAALPGNPASLHASGRRAKLRLEEARERIAAALGAHPSEVILTSGGTEADNLAVQGLYRARRAAAPERTRIVLIGIEHHAVLDVVDWLAAHEGAEPVLVPVDDDGRVDLAAWGAALAAAPERTALATLMWANNEIGTVQPVAEAARLAADHGVPLHTDAVQALDNRIPAQTQTKQSEQHAHDRKAGRCANGNTKSSRYKQGKVPGGTPADDVR